jgi:hypothetical protein
VHAPVAQGVPSSKDILMATQRATAVIRPDITAHVNTAPVDEFHDNDTLIVGCFPDKFLLGWFFLHALSSRTFMLIYCRGRRA